MKKNYSEYFKAIHYLEGLSNISSSYQKTNLKSHPNPKMYLERMQDFLDLLGNPEKSFKYIHITGTAGKGSVSSLVHNIIFSNNKKVGLFTSPFVTSTIEKIKVGDKYIDPIIFAEITNSLKPHIDNMARNSRHGLPSYFEIILAIALIYFKKTKCEYVILEVGLGGSYDATNIIQNPLITAITNIDLDHTEILGKTKEEIATDKAGIIKKNSIFLTTENNNKILSIFEEKCKTVGAVYSPCRVVGLDYSARNFLLAKNISTSLGMKAYDNYSNNKHTLPARFEIIENKPLIIIDGAHNVSKMKSTLINLEKQKYKKLSCIVAFSADKDWKQMLKILLPRVDVLYVTRFSIAGRKCINPKELLEFAKKYLKVENINLNTDPIFSFLNAKKYLSKDDALLITGSFYLAGDIRSIYCPEEKILKQRNSHI